MVCQPRTMCGFGTTPNCQWKTKCLTKPAPGRSQGAISSVSWLCATLGFSSSHITEEVSRDGDKKRLGGSGAPPKHSVVVVHGEDFWGGVFVGVDVGHPAEDYR